MSTAQARKHINKDPALSLQVLQVLRQEAQEFLPEGEAFPVSVEQWALRVRAVRKGFVPVSGLVSVPV